jgi:predicted porin
MKRRRRVKKLYQRCGLSICLLCIGAHAKADNVVLYGIVDTGVAYLTNTTQSHGNTVETPLLTGTVPSRWGLKGSENLGDGVQVIFDLENGFSVANGTVQQGGRLFGRNAYVGLSSDTYGTLTFGRQLTMLDESLAYGDLIGPSLFSLADFDSYIPNARADNSVRYMFSIPHVKFGATYSFGRDGASGPPPAANCAGQVAGDFLACRDISFMAGFEFGPGGASVAYDEQRGNTGDTDGLTTPQQKHMRMLANGYFWVGPVKFGGGWYGQKIEAAKDATINIYFAGASWNPTPALNLTGQVAREIVAQNSDSTLYIARAEYSLSAVTAAYVMYAYMNNSAKAAVPLGAASVGLGLNSQGVMVGLRHMF